MKRLLQKLVYSPRTWSTSSGGGVAEVTSLSTPNSRLEDPTRSRLLPCLSCSTDRRKFEVAAARMSVVRLRGLPFNTTPEEVAQWFVSAPGGPLQVLASC